jgi:hypothetical protein
MQYVSETKIISPAETITTMQAATVTVRSVLRKQVGQQTLPESHHIDTLLNFPDPPC